MVGHGPNSFETAPAFRGMVERCHNLLKEYASWSLIDELLADESKSRMQETAVAQPAIFVIQAALTALFETYGIRPAAAIGHSVGEVAAAWAAGVLTLDEALRVIYHRGRSMDRASSRGRMMAVGLGPEDIEPFIAAVRGKVEVGAVNSPESVTLSGDAGALEALEPELAKRGIFARILPVVYAFHSRQMEPVREDLLASLGVSRQGSRPSVLSRR